MKLFEAILDQDNPIHQAPFPRFVALDVSFKLDMLLKGTSWF
jgi:hypothetical protein